MSFSCFATSSIFIICCALSVTARSDSKTLRHSISTVSHTLKHLTVAEINAILSPKRLSVPPSRFEVQNALDHCIGTGLPTREKQTCFEVVLWGVRTKDLELGEALTHGTNSRGPNPDYDFKTRKNALTHGDQIRTTDLELENAEHPRGSNPEDQIWTTTLELVHAVLRLNIKEDPHT